MSTSKDTLPSTRPDVNPQTPPYLAYMSTTRKPSKDKTAKRSTAKAAAKATDGYVHENPWKSVGIAAGVGLLLGMLIGRR